MPNSKFRTTDDYTKAIAAFAMIVFYAANSVFVLKYGARHFAWNAVLVFAAVYGALCIGALRFGVRNTGFLKSRALLWGVILSVAIATIVLLSKVPQNAVLNDRYFMVQIFWQNLFHGLNPYHPHLDAFSANVPGAFPFYFLMAVPAFLLGEIGLLTLSGFGIFVYCLNRTYKGRTRHVFAGLLLTIMSIAFWYEIPARSTLFFNMSIVVWYMGWFLRKRQWSALSVVVAGILGGAALSTRNIVILPMAACYFYSLKIGSISKSKVLTIISIDSLVFAAPIALLWLWQPSDFVRYNPFKIQLVYGTPLVLPAMAIMGWGVSRIAKSFEQLVFGSGLMLLCIVFAQNASRIVEGGWHACIFNSAMDISLMVMALPFLALGAPAFFLNDETAVNGPTRSVL